MLKRCEICGKEFETTKNTKTCSEECKIELKVRTLKRQMDRKNEKRRTGNPVGRPKKRGPYKERVYKIDKNDTLCWSCQNATGKCRWSSLPAKPVEGWTVVEITLKHHNGKDKPVFTDSFFVRECPHYIQDEPR